MSNCAKFHSRSLCSDTSWAEDNFVGFREEPNCGRGTAGIIWSCLTVMAFSAWSVIHLDTKPFSSRPTTSLFWKPWTKILKKSPKQLEDTPLFDPTARKLFKALTILLFPEYGVLVAVEELTVARLIQHTTRDIYGWEAFSLKQAHLIRMGGIYIPYIEKPEHFAHFVTQNARVLKYDQFPSEARISLRAKRDVVDKVVALSQVIYFICNMAVRSVRYFRISVLELVTLNYIAYASITFLLLLRKPQELHEAFELDLAELPSPTCLADTETIRHPRLEKWIWFGMAVAIIAANLFPFAVLLGRQEFWSRASNKSPEGDLSSIFLMGVLAILMFMLRRSLESHQWNRDTILKSVAWYLSLFTLYSCGLLYIGARIWLIVIVIRAFAIAPEGIYIAPRSWTQYLGHVGA